MFKDYLGKDITVGAKIIFAGRKGSSIALLKGVVVEATVRQLRDWRTGQPKTDTKLIVNTEGCGRLHLRNLNRVLVAA